MASFLVNTIIYCRPRSRSSRSSRADDSMSVASSRSGRKQERLSSHESVRSGRKSNNQSQDYTDDSYTLTESEMSFDIPETRPRRSSRDVRSGRRSVDLPIKEEEEGEILLLWVNAYIHVQQNQQVWCKFILCTELITVNFIAEDFEESGKIIISYHCCFILNHSVLQLFSCV